MRDGGAVSAANIEDIEASGSDALDTCLMEAKNEILRRCGVHIRGNDPVMAVLVAQDVFARRHADLVDAAVSAAADRLADQLDRREALMRERLDRHLADATREGVSVVHGAALDQRAEFLSAMRTLTERQERAARAAGRAQLVAMLGATTTFILTTFIALGIF